MAASINGCILAVHGGIGRRRLIVPDEPDVQLVGHVLGEVHELAPRGPHHRLLVHLVLVDEAPGQVVVQHRVHRHPGQRRGQIDARSAAQLVALPAQPLQVCRGAASDAPKSSRHATPPTARATPAHDRKGVLPGANKATATHWSEHTKAQFAAGNPCARAAACAA